MRIYLAGKMTGLEQFGFPIFDAAQKKLEKLGHVVVSPAQLDRARGFDPDNLHPDFNMADTLMLDLLVIKDCEAVVLLDNWEDSRGARLERAWAECIGKKVITYQDILGTPSYA